MMALGVTSPSTPSPNTKQYLKCFSVWLNEPAEHTCQITELSNFLEGSGKNYLQVFKNTSLVSCMAAPLSACLPGAFCLIYPTAGETEALR